MLSLNKGVGIVLGNNTTPSAPKKKVNAWKEYVAQETGGTGVFRKYKSGGSMNDKNIIPDGVLHREKNDLGDKGIPVVDKNGSKRMELEKEELILTHSATQKVEQLVSDIANLEATGESTDALLEELGIFVTEQVMTNTDDKSGKFKDLSK